MADGMNKPGWGLSPSWRLQSMETPAQVAERKKQEQVQKVQGKYIPPYLRAPTTPVEKKPKAAKKAPMGADRRGAVATDEDLKAAKRVAYGLFSQVADTEAAQSDRPILNTILSAVTQPVGPQSLVYDAIDKLSGKSDDDIRNKRYNPLVVDQMLGMPSAIGMMFDQDAAPSDALTRTMKADDALRDRYGVPLPQNFAETGQELFGSLLLPVKLPKVAKVGQNATRVEKGINAAARFGAGASELFLPGRQTGLLPAVAMNLPFGIGVAEGLDAFIPGGMDNYKGLPELITGQPQEVPQDVGTSTIEIDEISDEEAQAIEASASGIEIEEITDEEAAMFEGQGIAPVGAMGEVVPEHQGLTNSEKVMLGLGGATALLGLAFGAKNVIRSATKQKVQLPGGDLSGTKFVQQTSSWLDNRIAGLTQGDNVARTAYRKAAKLLGKPDIIAAMEAKMDRLVASSMNTRIKHATQTGELPESSVRMKPLAPQLEAMVSELNETELGMLNRGLLAKSALNQIKKASKGGATVQPQFNQYTPEQLKAFADIIDSDPKLAKYAKVVPQAYRELLDFELEQGLISQKKYKELIDADPDYVHMNRSMAFDNDASGGPGPSDASSLKMRATDEGGGVQAGETANTITDLPKYMQATIRRAQINTAQRELLEVLESAPAFGIKRVDSTGPDTITVMIKGVETHFKIPDNGLRGALEFGPNIANNVVANLGRSVNSLFIAGTVGKVLNPLFAFTSAGYEGFSSSALRPKGYHLGLINEFLSKKGMSIGLFDPTGGIAAVPVGAVRYAWDSGIQALAQSTAKQLFQEDGVLYSALGPQALQRLHDRLALAYDGSIKAAMQREGISSSSMFRNDDALKPMENMEDVFPGFTQYANKLAAAEALDGSTDFLRKYWSNPTHGLMSAAASNRFARGYNSVSNAIRESVKYQGYASNVAKTKNAADRAILATQTRRLTGDIGQRGNARGAINGTIQTAGDNITFFNNAIQPIAELSKRMADNPALAFNVGATILGAATWQYLAAATDPKVAETLRTSTDEQNASRVLFPGGISIPISQELRVIWGPFTALLNEVSGINEGQYNPDFAEVFSRWADSDFSIDEETEMAMKGAAKSGFNSANPFALSNIPVANAIAASKGADLGMSRYGSDTIVPFGGDLAEIQQQDRSLLGGEGKLEDNAISARTEKVISSLLGPIMGNVTASGLDYWRAQGKTQLDGSAIEPDEAAAVSLSRLLDASGRSNGPIESMLFSNYTKPETANDTAMKMYYSKREGIDVAMQLFREEIKYRGRTGADPRVDEYNITDIIKPDYYNTALMPIGAHTYKLHRDLGDVVARLNALTDQQKNIQNLYGVRIQDRNREYNKITAEKKELTEVILYNMRVAEELIREDIGDPSFTFQDMKGNFEKYKAMPYAPQVAPMPTDAPQ
jgi:hypothetical protein